MRRDTMPATLRECHAIKKALEDSKMSWTELTSRIGNRPKLAQHLMAGRQTPRGSTLAKLPDVVIFDYVKNLREAEIS